MEKETENVVGENEIDVIEEKKVSKNELQAKIQANLKKAYEAGKVHTKKHYKNPVTIIAIVVLAILIAGSYGYNVYRQKVDIGQEGVKAKVEKFLSENVPETAKTEVKEITKEGHLYTVNVSVNDQETPLYVTLDGKKMIIQGQGMLDLDQAPAVKEAQAPEKTEADVKSDVPVVDLFVMSYCPYGLQMERGVVPAIEALGSKIKFNLKFVDYTLHGPKEIVENVNQYCVQKVAPAKLGGYLKCFWADSKTAAAGTLATSCMKTLGINATQIATCVKATNEQFKPTEKAMGLDAAEAVKFGVQGSPTLVVNGTTVASGRDSASVLKAICSGFTTAPKECEKVLSATSPAAGFTDEALAGGASAAACGV
jgi:hypothetical protein